ncbi:glycosyltransferase family 2 protein [Prevotella sp. E13-27]|uniref:glycosyltransferase family 2 protein n=1 Tax=Prevotella sp. E13-27 TaxID=2938122 RepID=UPI00200A710C|nr:glycosyltransferase family 2 protein [Prevotella sp. E13-27]MCK8621329.1 glycosyltransferase [Prevotella sp. E13-27]
MKLSVITINYNNLEGLTRTCESVTSQSGREFEWIVIDGGSTDGGKEYLETLDLKPDYWCSERDNGIYSAMNKGIDIAHGEYMLFLNSGDMLASPDILQKVLPHLHDADIIYGNALFCKPKKERLVSYPETFTLYHLWKGFTPCHQATFIKSELLKGDGRYDEHYKIVADYKKWLEWKLNGCEFKHLPLTICRYMLDGISTRQKTLHQQEHDSVIDELFSPIIKEQMEYIEWLKTGKGKNKKEHDGYTKVITPLYIICWRAINSFIKKKNKT